MTEHAAVIFVFFFLAEYGSLLLMSILTSLLFLGGYLLDLSFFISPIIFLLELLESIFGLDLIYLTEIFSISNPTLDGVYSGVVLGIKSSMIVFLFIWVRASFPRIRFDQLMGFCWTVLLPLLFAFIILVPSLLYMFGVFFINISLF
jgi:NADH-ubiquinone oxidoreductase chain 1